MVKHVILWQLKDELSDAEKAAVKAGIKEGLEGLAGKVPGLVEAVSYTHLPHGPESGAAAEKWHGRPLHAWTDRRKRSARSCPDS